MEKLGQIKLGYKLLRFTSKTLEIARKRERFFAKSFFINPFVKHETDITNAHSAHFITIIAFSLTPLRMHDVIIFRRSVNVFAIVALDIGAFL